MNTKNMFTVLLLVLFIAAGCAPRTATQASETMGDVSKASTESKKEMNEAGSEAKQEKAALDADESKAKAVGNDKTTTEPKNEASATNSKTDLQENKKIDLKKGVEGIKALTKREWCK
ncbi:MAG: hypothetical protein EPN22_01520 [Nitrospirae bacterium]|nr:MAG: hypothetical protein EPN22_01520 [Nitrospirota bacterium]